MRVWKEGTGAKPWRVRGYDETGRKVQRSFQTKAQAEEFDRDVETRKARAAAGLPTQQGPISLRALSDLYLENQPAKKSDRWFRAMLGYTLAEFGDYPVRGLRSEEYGRWLHALPYSAKTKTSILSTARQVIKAGVEWGYLERNPLRPGAVNGPGTKRVRPIRPFETWAEVEATAKAVGKHADVVRFLALTGLRPGELLRLEWRHYAPSFGTIAVPGTKTEAAQRTIPLCAPARRLLNSRDRRPLGDDPTDRIFPMNFDEWRDTRWKDAFTTTGLPYRPPYELRHTFATLALERGVPIETLSKLLGHTTIDITLKFYAKFTRRKLEQDVALLDNITDPDGHLADTESSDSA